MIDLQFWIPIIFSIVAILISLFAYSQAWKLRISSIYTELAQQANLINDSWVQYKLKSPYSIFLKDNSKLGEFEKIVAIFFHHINLLQIVYKNKDYLEKKEFERYENWILKIFKPWLDSDPRLIELWNEMKKRKDIPGDEFISWVEENFQNQN